MIKQLNMIINNVFIPAIIFLGTSFYDLKAIESPAKASI